MKVSGSWLGRWSVAMCLAALGCEAETGTSGEGGGDQGGAPAAGPTLFVVSLNDGVSSFEHPQSLSGRVEPSTHLEAGADTDLYGPRDAAVGANGDLYVASENDGAIVVYADATKATGATLPSRKWKGSATGLEVPNGIALDASADTAYVINNPSIGAVDNAIFVFEDASTADGDVEAARRIDVDATEFAPLQIVLEGERLFVVTQLSGNATSVMVFDDASTLDGTVAPSRTISDPAWTEVLAICVDDEDHLFAVDEGSVVYRYDGASSLSGSVSPAATLTIEGVSSLAGLACALDGTVYLADRSAAAILSLEEAATLSTGSLPPSGSFDSLDVSSPARLALLEP
ncbi:MAG: hypothetical protein IPM79_18910 [Polyangiaceae bacterium]|jgi:sugar lactone lactonase YvrE|nr:hypothetical protein [Polyangiaceae bacterium]MBK8939627.1 hypothetical protein [Polyangiaceae bacterium]